MTLARVIPGFLLVAVLFGASATVGRQPGATLRGPLLIAAVEALAATLLAGLWFASLGTGGSVMVFLLLGAVVASAERGTQAAQLRSAFPQAALGIGVTLGRYLAAGGLLAWLLG